MGTCFVIGLVVVAVVFGPNMAPYVSHTLPNTKLDFIGRDQDMKILLEALDFSNNSFRFVNIIGPPGFGKSALAINIGHTMLARRTDVYYINLIDFPEKNFKQVLTEKILISDDNNVEKSVTFENLVKWGRKRWWTNCLIILDNCDDSIEKQKENFYYAIDTLLLHSSSNLKLLTTSREAIYHSDSHFVHRVHPIDVESACQMLELRNPSLLNDSEKTVIANLTGEVPLALRIVGALLSNRIHSATEIIENLKKQPISTLSPPELWSSMQLNVSISLSYNYLDQNVQRVGRYLAFFPGSFDLLTAVGVVNPHRKQSVNSQVKLSLNKLVQLSLLEYDEKSNRYIYHKLIKDYFSMHRTSKEYAYFIVAMKKFYSVRLCEITEEFKISPRVALHQLEANRHHIELLMALISLKSYAKFDLSFAACFLYALKTKLLTCRFPPQTIITTIRSYTISFNTSFFQYLESNKKNLGVFYAKDMALEFTVYADLVVKLSDLLQQVGKYEEAIKITKDNLPIIDRFCLFQFSKEACRNFYAYILTHYENEFEAENAKLYHQKFLKRSELTLPAECESSNSAECNNIKIAMSYLSLKDYKKAKKFFEKALYDNEIQYPIYDSLFMLLWLHKNYKTSTNTERVENYLKNIYNQLINMTASELYVGPSSLLQEYQDYLKSINEDEKAYSILERWIEVMEEIGLASSHQEIKLARKCAIKLYHKGYYNRSLNIVQHVLSFIEAKSFSQDYINFHQLRGSLMLWLKNFTESVKSYKRVIEHILLYNMTSNYVIFNEVCWDLPYYLHNFDYLFICYTDKFVNSINFLGKAFFYILFKSPFVHVPIKSPKESVKVDIPLEYFPSLIQQSHHTDLVSSEAGDVLIYKPDFAVIVSSNLKSLLRVVWYFFVNLIESNCLRLCCNFVSIFIRLVILKFLLQLLCCLISNCFKLFLNFLYISTLFFMSKLLSYCS